MSLPTCIAQLQAAGALDAERAARFAEMYAAREAQYAKSMAQAAAAARASADTMDAVEAEALQRRRQELLQIRAQQGILKAVGDHVAAGGRAADAAIAHFDMELHTQGISNIDARKRAIVGRAHAQIAGMLRQFDRDVTGRVREPARLKNLVRELFGENTGDVSASELAAAWREAAETLRQRFNAAGGHIAKREDWGLPQAHLSEKVRAASFEEWRDFIRPRLDPAKMTDETTGLPFTPPALEAALLDVWRSIRSGGWDDRTPGAMSGTKLANKRADPRFLVFRDADSWLQYQDRFGVGSPFDAMMGHIDGMARDIAQMEILGPNPSATVKWLTDLLEQDAAVSTATGDEYDALRNAASTARFQINAMHNIFTGEVNRPVNAKLARRFSTVRSIQTAAKLGGAALSAVTDLGFQHATAAFNGLEYGKIIANYAKLLNPLDASDREFAVASGLIAEEAAARMGSLWRYDDTVNSTEVARRLANGVLRLSGLSAWTQAGKWAFGMEFMHALGRAADREWSGLDKGLRRALERYGIGEADWATIRSAPRYEHKGARFLRPDDVPDDALATRLAEMISTEARFAVPEASLRARAVMTGNIKAGTVTGELFRSVMQFKAFPVSILLTHGLRAVIEKGALGKAGLLANVAIMTTAFGALALQMKQVTAGKDPRDMTEPEFWGAAFAQGGGAGLFGDFLYANTNRFGGNINPTIVGPTISSAVELLDLAKRMAVTAEPGDQADFAKFLQANTPGSSLWYARLALNRVFFDQVLAETDPDAARAFERMEKRAQDDFDQAFWWHPGETAPERAPELEAVAGGSQ